MIKPVACFIAFSIAAQRQAFLITRCLPPQLLRFGSNIRACFFPCSPQEWNASRRPLRFVTRSLYLEIASPRHFDRFFHLTHSPAMTCPHFDGNSTRRCAHSRNRQQALVFTRCSFARLWILRLQMKSHIAGHGESEAVRSHHPCLDRQLWPARASIQRGERGYHLHYRSRGQLAGARDVGAAYADIAGHALALSTFTIGGLPGKLHRRAQSVAAMFTAFQSTFPSWQIYSFRNRLQRPTKCRNHGGLVGTS